MGKFHTDQVLGFSEALMPALSDIHLQYAQSAPHYEDMFFKPIIGWVNGIHLDDIGRAKPQVFNGGIGECSADKAVVMHVTLKPGKAANIGIVNIQRQGDGDVFEFAETGFSAEQVLVNGVEMNFADYLAENKIDIRQPLVADYSGAMINVSFREVNPETRHVSFYAPVFKGVIGWRSRSMITSAPLPVPCRRSTAGSPSAATAS